MCNETMHLRAFTCSLARDLDFPCFCDLGCVADVPLPTPDEELACLVSEILHCYQYTSSRDMVCDEDMGLLIW